MTGYLQVHAEETDLDPILSEFLIVSNQSGMNKGGAVTALQKLCDHISSAIEVLTAVQLSETIIFFRNDVNRRQVMLFLGNHKAEHLGQLVAYVKINGVLHPGICSNMP